MKKSNLFILSSALLIWGFFVGTNTLLGKYVTVFEFENNRLESVKSLDIDTYNYETILFDKPFNEVIFQDTIGERNSHFTSNNRKKIHWVMSEKSGLKRYSDYRSVLNYKIENNKLIIYVNSTNYFPDNFILYSPSLAKIEIDRISNFELINTEMDSLEIESFSGNLKIAESNQFSKLTIKGHEISSFTVEAKTIGNVAYILSNSRVHSQIDSCNSLSIQGDSSSTVFISPLIEGRKSPHSLYNYITYNDNMGDIVIENTTVNQIRGDKEKMTLNMTIKQIEETLRNISNN